MNAETIGLVIAALFSGGGIAALVNTFTTRKTAEADATATLSAVWLENITRLQQDVTELRARVALLEADLAKAHERERILRTVLYEHRIDLPEDM